MAGLKFRILLDSAESTEIFRDVVVPDSANFEDLFKICMQAFQFKGDQMASFYMSNDEWDKGQEITLMDMSFGEEPNPTPTMVGSNIKDFLEAPDQKIILVYDFIRMWIFLFELIGYEKETSDEPVVMLSVGESPKEDSKSAEDNDGLFMGDFEEDDDEFGFNDFDDDFSDEDYSNFDDFE